MEFSRPEYWSGSLSLLQGIFPTGSNPGLSHCRWVLYHCRFFTREAQDTGVGSLSLLQRIFPTQELALGSPALQADSLPTELSGKRGLNTHTHKLWFTVYRAELMNLHWFNSNSKMITYFPPRGNSLGKRHTSTPQVPEGCKLVSRHHMHKHMFFVWPTNTVKI